jgi:hypothetical protein
MPKLSSASLFLLVSLAALFWSGAAFAEDAVDFEQDVWPILMDKCVVCHGPGDAFNDLRMDSKDAILKGGKNGKIVEPGDPDKSSMYVRTNLPADDFDIMPAEGDPLTPEQVEKIRLWIAAGAEFGDWVGF